MASPLDANQFTAKERNAARKELLKKIDIYNKQKRKNREVAFPLTPPSVDLVYRGVLKVTYDRGYALQTKSLLLGSDTTAEEVIDQLIDSLNLTGSPDDYILEERNHLTQDIRPLKKTESPLNIQLQYAAHSSILEIRLVQIRDSHITMATRAGSEAHNHHDDDDDMHRGSMIPKDEVTDHGTANVEISMDEALEDLPPLVHDIQERLRLLSETAAVSGKSRSNPPSRRLLWDTLKPRISALVKDIRHLVDNGEFIATRHCPAPECRLIVTLLLELITDYSRELITVTKELCGIKGVTRTDFAISVGNFDKQITYISRLVERTGDSLHAVALSGHLLYSTAPENFIKTPLENDSIFTGSRAISGILIFTSITAYLGLIRAGYEEKTDYLAALANNMLLSTNKALEVIQKTNEYSLIHLHPLKSRVNDMEHKLKVSMDTLVRKVKVASSRHPPPDAAPDLLLSGHNLIAATLDYLMVAQCASLLHKVTITGWDLLQLPWVQGWLNAKGDDNKTVQDEAKSVLNDHLSTTSDEKSTGASTTSSGKKRSNKERKSRIPLHKRDKQEMKASDDHTESDGVSFGQIGLNPNNLPLNYLSESGDDADDEGTTRSRKTSYNPRSDSGTDTTSPSESISYTNISPKTLLSPHLFTSDKTAQYTGIDAVKRLRQHHILNKAIAKVAESLLVTVTQKISILSLACQDKARDNYGASVEAIIDAARQIRQEVSIMECDVLGSHNMQDILKNSQERIDSAIRNCYLSLTSASSSQASDKDRARLLTSITNISDISSTTVGDALSAVSEHKKALTQAEKLEQEFVALMTGQTVREHEVAKTIKKAESPPASSSRRKMSSRIAADSEAESVIFEESIGMGSGWGSKATPKIVGGTLEQLTQRVTYYRVVDAAFVDTFMLVFHRYLSPDQFLQILVSRYNITPSSELDRDECEIFESEVAVPIKLRVVHALKAWLLYHAKDFGPPSLKQTLTTLLQEIKKVMPVAEQQLQATIRGETSVDYNSSVLRKVSQPILPLHDTAGKNFKLLNCNTLELARQLCLTYFGLLATLQLKEFMTFSWEAETSSTDTLKETDVANNGIQAFKLFSRNLSILVCHNITRETNEQKQSLVISYFIKTGESCQDLKNYEALQSIVNGLTASGVQESTRGAWQMLSDGQLQMYRSLRDLTSPDANYSKYRSDIKNTQMSPSIPLLDVVLKDISHINREAPDHHTGQPSILNFTKWREFSKILKIFHRCKHTSYSLQPVEVIQDYLKKLQKTLHDDDWEALN